MLASLPLGNIGWNGNGRSLHLTRQTIRLRFWKVTCDLINQFHQVNAGLPNPQVSITFNVFSHLFYYPLTHYQHPAPETSHLPMMRRVKIVFIILTQHGRFLIRVASLIIVCLLDSLCHLTS